MKKKYIFPVILGGTFFAVPYLAMNLPIIPSLVSAGVAYSAGWLIFSGKDTNNEIDFISNLNNAETIKKARQTTTELKNISSKVENKKLINNINQIVDISNKILDTLDKKPEKINKANNFLNYYLPVTIKILKRYDDIENQNLETQQARKFMNSVENMIEKIKIAFAEQLENMYHSDIIDTNAEIKVFESMLKSDGLLTDEEFEIIKNENEGGKQH